MFCDLLDNDHPVYRLEQKVKSECGRARTNNVSKWLRLASQIDSVKMNMFRYEQAHQYCEPVAEELYSNANHYSSIVTPLTRFVFVANALEETYRFASPSYEEKFSFYKVSNPRLERKRDYSMQAAWLLEETLSETDAPTHYRHKVDILLRLTKLYQSNFNVKFYTDLECVGGISYGLSLVRDIRNQIAHAEFPIIDDPEYTHEFSEPSNKRLIIQLLELASRIAAMNIQMLLRVTNDGFNSDGYHYLCSDPDYGDRLESLCTTSYLDRLHIEQEFGLNESSMWGLRDIWNDSDSENLDL
jgi:hypothetical protein